MTDHQGTMSDDANELESRRLGAGRLRQVDIHASDRFATEWLED